MKFIIHWLYVKFMHLNKLLIVHMFHCSVEKFVSILHVSRLAFNNRYRFHQNYDYSFVRHFVQTFMEKHFPNWKCKSMIAFIGHEIPKCWLMWPKIQCIPNWEFHEILMFCNFKEFLVINFKYIWPERTFLNDMHMHLNNFCISKYLNVNLEKKKEKNFHY